MACLRASRSESHVCSTATGVASHSTCASIEPACSRPERVGFLFGVIDCFEPRSALLGSGSPALCRDDFVVERWLALTPSVASLQTLTLRSSVRFRGVAPHHRSPTSAMQPAGQDLGAPLAPEIKGQYRSNGARMPVLSGQCCRSRSATFDRRIAAADHSRETGSIATACLARSSSPLSPRTPKKHR